MHVHENNEEKIGWTIALNLIITVAEYFGGIFSGSLALISDAGHNLSDVISLTHYRTHFHNATSRA